MLHRCLFLCLWTLLTLTPSLQAADITLFGPACFEREPGQPETYTETFTTEPGQASLSIVNGNTNASVKDGRLSSATVSLNGLTIFGSKDFSRQVHELEAKVDLLASNTLEVSLASGPDGYLTLVLTREKLGPSVGLAAIPATICPGQESLLVWDSSGAETCSIEPDVGPVPLSGSTPVSPSTSTTYVIRAKSHQGQANATAHVTVQPEVSAQMTAFPETISAGGSATLSWHCQNAHNCTISPDIGAVEPVGSVTVSPTATTTYFLTAVGTSATATAEATVTVGPGLEVVIVSPHVGETFIRPDVLVQGQVLDSQASRLGVMVDGRPALVDGNRFYANHVPLVPGNNTISVFASDSDGRTGYVLLNVVHQEPERYVEVAPSELWGVAPFETPLRVDGNFDLIGPVLSGDGPGPVEFNATEEENRYLMRVADPGLYRISLTAGHPSGESYTDEVFVQIVDRHGLDDELQALWQDIQNALVQQDLDRALSYFTHDNRELYREIFTTLYNDLPLITTDMQPMEMIYANDEIIKYRIPKEEYYGGELITITHHVYFTRGSDGLWKILRY